MGSAVTRMITSHIACAALWSALVLSLPAPLRAEPPKLPVPATDQSAVGQRGYFYVGGKYVGPPGQEMAKAHHGRCRGKTGADEGDPGPDDR